MIAIEKKVIDKLKINSDKKLNNFIVKRGQIYLANLKGLISKHSILSPVLIIQNNKGNKFSPCTIVIVGTNCKGKQSLFNWDVSYMTTLDKRRLVEQIGIMDPIRLKEVEKQLVRRYG